MYAYNPRKKSSQELEKSLVGKDRWDVLNNILKELTIEDGEGPKQHWMIVGPRGIGKSHLLTLLYYKITGNQKLSKLWIPILFPENLRMAGNLTKFLERVANEILIEFDQEKKPISHEMKQKIQKIRKVPLKERADYLFSILSWVHRKTGKYILLITENLQQLLGKKIIPIEQKKLRAFLQTSDAVLIIGSATTIFDALHDHSHPFYHFFHIRRLEDLSFDNMKTLIISLLSESERPELIKEVENRDARLKTLYSFTGGNPRMAVFLSDIIRTEVPDEMLELMDNILDQLTPYFEAILNDIPDYLEEIINTLAAFEPAQSPREIAEYLEAPQATIRNYLKQLKEAGYVRIAFSKGKSNYYCLNEYLYRIWYQMRDNSHREEARWLMELLLMLYSPDKIIKERNKVKVSVQKEEAAFSYEKLIVQAPDFIARYPDTCMIIESCVNFAKDNKKGAIIYEKEKELLKEAFKYIEDNQYDQAIKLCKDTIKNNPKLEDGYVVWGTCLREQERYDEAIVKFQKAIEINPKSEQAYWLLGDCLRKQQRYKEAIDKFKEAIKIDSKSYASYGAMGDCFRELSLHDEAEKKYKKAIEINNEYEDAYSAWGACLHKQERYEEAIEKFKQAIEINPESEDNPWSWGICLMKLKRYEEAIKIFEKYLPGSEDIDVIYSYGNCLMGAKRYSEALKQFERLINIQPEYYQVYLPYGQLLEKKQDKELALLAYLKHISFGSMAVSGDFDFYKIYNEQIIPLIKALKPGKYIKQFYATENDKKFPEPILSIFLILLAKYDTVSENIQDIVKTYLEKEDEEINDFNLFIFTIKLSIWLKLCEDNLSDGLRLVDLYIEYIKSLKSAKEKENEVSNFSMGLFRVQINLGIDPQNTKKILNCLKSADDVPFSDVLLKIWTCISEPDSVDAQRYLSDKAIADVVMELRADDSTSKT